MAILNPLRAGLFVMIWLVTGAQAFAGGNFIALCYHEVDSDTASRISPMAIRASDLAAQFAWLAHNGYQPVSLQQILDSREKGRDLPDKAVLLTFDDGKKDVYTRVFPLLKMFRFPAVVAIMGRWLESAEGEKVDYDGNILPRNAFVSWEEIKEMHHSGLVEVASHSFDLHHGTIANPQGNSQPAATSRIYASGQYESDEAYLQRIEKDLRKNRDIIQHHTGTAPLAMVWPYGRSNLAIQQVAARLGMSIGLTLESGVNDGNTPLPALKRYLIENSPPLQDFVGMIRRTWSADPARSVRIVPARWADSEATLSQTLDRLLKLRPNIVVVDPRKLAENSASALFPTSSVPDYADRLNRIAWQIERRAGCPVFIDIPGEWLTHPAILSDLARQVHFAGIRVTALPGEESARRAISAIERWNWPLRVMYSLQASPPATVWAKLQPSDLIAIPAIVLQDYVIPPGREGQMLIEFNPDGQSDREIAQAMHQSEIKGLRQFGLTGFPDLGFDRVWMVLSLRSRPILP